MARAPITPLDAALETVGDRWTLGVVAALLDGPRRFGDLQEALPGIAPNILTQRLRRLEAHGLLMAEAYSDRPPRVVYGPTDGGRGLARVLRPPSDWGGRPPGAEPPRPAACGAPAAAPRDRPTRRRPPGARHP